MVTDGSDLDVYRPTARMLHWTVAVLVAVQVVIGVVMTYEAPEPNVIASLTTTLALFDVHKLLGLTILALMLLRLINRIVAGVPPEPQNVATWQRETSTLVHAWMYFLLLLIPLLGWVGVSLYPALTVFGTITLPALTAPDQARSAAVFVAHGIAALVLVALVLAHFGAAMFHQFVRGDGVLRRMLPSLSVRRPWR
jgi:cytochrome b561